MKAFGIFTFAILALAPFSAIAQEEIPEGGLYDVNMPDSVIAPTVELMVEEPIPVHDLAETMQVFNPDPTRAVWLSALCPGLGQIYNRRYWKLPIIVGGYMGLAYATDWNNQMLSDYTKAYRDLMDNDPDTKSYMDFFAPSVQETQLSKSWLENTFRSRKNYFRRNRDLCIIGMVGVYLLAILDSYVDASLCHFDVSPVLTMDWSPTIITESHSAARAYGLQCAFVF